MRSLLLALSLPMSACGQNSGEDAQAWAADTRGVRTNAYKRKCVAWDAAAERSSQG